MIDDVHADVHWPAAELNFSGLRGRVVVAGSLRRVASSRAPRHIRLSCFTHSSLALFPGTATMPLVRKRHAVSESLFSLIMNFTY